MIRELEAPARSLRRRLECEGAQGLRDAELLALLFDPAAASAEGTPGAAPLKTLTAPGVLPAGAQGVTLRALTARHGLGRRDAVRLLVCVELAGRWREAREAPVPAITTPRDCLLVLQDFRDRPTEHFLALYLNTRNHLLRQEVVAIGGLNASAVQPRDVLAPALRLGAAAVIVAHNHPSGDVQPSEEDLHVTRQLQAAGRLLGVEVLDHLVLAPRRYLSLRQEKLMAPGG